MPDRHTNDQFNLSQRRSFGRPLAALLFWVVAACGQDTALSSPSVVKVVADHGQGAIRQGSGVVVGPGLVATNAHVTVGALAVRVSSGTQTWVVQSRKDDPHRDLSVLVVQGFPLPAASAASAMPGVGQPVTAIGFPAGQGPKASTGKITGLWSYLGAEVLQSDAITAPGSSGGGLFDHEGRLLGLTTFFFVNSPGIHFSIPVRWIQELMGDPEAKAVQSAFLTELQMPSFIDTLASNPANQPAWDAFTRAWVQSAPGDPDAWFAFANSMEPAREPGRIQERIAAYDRSLALRNDSPKVWNNLGVSLALLNRFKESEVAFRRALALYPGYGLAWLNLGGLLLDLRRPGEASESLICGVGLLPDNAEGWAHLGEAQMNLSRPTEAALYYLTALGLSPFRVEWWTDLARACDKAGDEPGLQKALVRLATLDPPQAKTLAKELKRLHAH